MPGNLLCRRSVSPPHTEYTHTKPTRCRVFVRLSRLSSTSLTSDVTVCGVIFAAIDVIHLDNWNGKDFAENDD